MNRWTADYSAPGAFGALLEQRSLQPSAAANTLSDGTLHCTYAALPTLLAPIRDRLRVIRGSFSQGAEQETVAYECPTSLPGALVLMALMAEEQSLVLLPSSTAELGLAPSPRFCRHILRLSAGTSPAATDLSGENVVEHLQIIEQVLDQRLKRPASSGPLFHLRTSGSMGRAKLVTHEQSTLLGNAANVAQKYRLVPEDRIFIPVPLAHMYGFGAAFLSGLLAGASMEIQGRSNLLTYLDRERRFLPNVAWVTPTHCEMLQRGFKSPHSGYRLVITSGQRIPEALQRAFDPLVCGTLVNQYGSSELGAVAACAPGDSLEEKVATLGSGFPGVELRVVLEDESSSAGVGPLQVKHPYGFIGYRDDDGQWLLRRESSDWFGTGDLARALDGGNRIQVVGRAGQSVNRRGYLIQLEELEHQLEQLEGVGQAIALSIPVSSAHGDTLAAFLIARPGVVLDVQSLRLSLATKLPQHATPDYIHVTDTLPLLPSGKVDRQSLIQQVIWQLSHSQEQNR